MSFTVFNTIAKHTIKSTLGVGSFLLTVTICLAVFLIAIVTVVTRTLLMI